MTPTLKQFPTALVALGMTLGPSLAFAEPSSDQQRAEHLFDAATALVKQGDIAAACPKFEESQRLDPALGTQYNLALCYQQLGRLGSAWHNLRAVERLAHATGKTIREEAARSKLVELRSRAPHFVFSVEAGDPTLWVDGERVEKEDWSYYVVNPGEHVIEATASAKMPWRTRLTVAAAPDGSGPAVRVAVPPLAPAKGRTQFVQVPSSAGVRRNIGIVLGGIGAAALAAAAVSGVLILDAKSTADARCNPKPMCDEEGHEAVERGKTLVVINYAAWGVGALGIGIGTLLYFTSRSPRGAAYVWPIVSASGAGLGASTSF